LGAPLFIFARERKRGLNAEGAEVRAQSSQRREKPKSTASSGCATGAWMELTEGQMRVVERLFRAGFRPIAIPPYESALIVRKGECVAVLGPVENGGLKLLVPVTILVDGNLSVKLKKSSGDVFVWKKKEVPAREEMLRELEEFGAELAGILESYEL
jgi:hypothetical protein